jgi:hypothetical protein
VDLSFDDNYTGTTTGKLWVNEGGPLRFRQNHPQSKNVTRIEATQGSCTVIGDYKTSAERTPLTFVYGSGSTFAIERHQPGSSGNYHIDAVFSAGTGVTDVSAAALKKIRIVTVDKLVEVQGLNPAGSPATCTAGSNPKIEVTFQY